MRLQFLGKRASNLHSATGANVYRLQPLEVFEASADDALAFVANGVAQRVPAETALGVAPLIITLTGTAPPTDETSSGETDTSYASMTRDDLEQVIAERGATLDDIEGTGKDGNVIKDDIVKFLMSLDNE